MEGETTTAVEDLVFRCLETSGGKCAGAYRQFAHELAEFGAVERGCRCLCGGEKSFEYGWDQCCGCESRGRTGEIQAKSV